MPPGLSPPRRPEHQVHEEPALSGQLTCHAADPTATRGLPQRELGDSHVPASAPAPCWMPATPTIVGIQPPLRGLLHKVTSPQCSVQKRTHQQPLTSRQRVDTCSPSPSDCTPWVIECLPQAPSKQCIHPRASCPPSLHCQRSTEGAQVWGRTFLHEDMSPRTLEHFPIRIAETSDIKAIHLQYKRTRFSTVFEHISTTVHITQQVVLVSPCQRVPHLRTYRRIS